MTNIKLTKGSKFAPINVSPGFGLCEDIVYKPRSIAITEERLWSVWDNNWCVVLAESHADY